jgi:hypothetical protein
VTKSTGKLRKRVYWQPADVDELRRRYPHEKTADIARDLRRRLDEVYRKAISIGLRKTADYLASPDACRLRRGDEIGKPYRYPKGHVPANKGTRRPGYAPGRMAETMFKKGQFPANKDPGFYVPGALRVNTDGYVDMRTSFAPGALGWTCLHRILWEDAHGPIPRGHVLKFKDGDKLNVELDNLELITLQENMARNTIARYPRELRSVMHLVRKAERKIRERQDNR